MRSAKMIKSVIVSAVIAAVPLFFLTVAMSSLTVSTAGATAAMAKGKPCTTCHTASPPTKANVKKKK